MAFHDSSAAPTNGVNERVRLRAIWNSAAPFDCISGSTVSPMQAVIAGQKKEMLVPKTKPNSIISSMVRASA